HEPVSQATKGPQEVTVPYHKKLIEVALPLAAISEAAAREKTIHTSMPANLHTWWSRKPLAAARAVLFASLVDDPANTLPPEAAETERSRLLQMVEQLASWDNIHDTHLLSRARE